MSTGQNGKQPAGQDSLPSFAQQQETSALYGGNAPYIEAYYEDYLKSPASVPEGWRQYFRGLLVAGNEGASTSSSGIDIAHGPIQNSFRQMARERKAGDEGVSLAPDLAEKQSSVLRIINAWRVRGHQRANLDPLGLWQRSTVPDLEPSFHGLSEADLDTEFNTGSLAAEPRMKLRDILDFIRKVYGGTVGAEYMHITATKEKRWIQSRLEGQVGNDRFSAEQRREILVQLTAAEGIEKYLHTKYVGQKRFSLEGGESLIPSMHAIIQQAASHNTEEVIIGMAHRGRLNVLVNVMGKSPVELFREFEGQYDIDSLSGSGDVKYHMGFSTDVDVNGKRVHLVLAFNPSHLEIVNPVVEGSVRARQHRRRDLQRDQVLPILIHGDAAFAGQGVIMETLQMSQIRGFATGGTMHVVINNQVGFTTSRADDARSTEYCTDVAKMVQAPIFHVNGDDPEAVAYVSKLAMEYRETFRKDVVIDLICYRRHGHNEADEPSVTQPMMYSAVKPQPSTRQLYAEQLADEDVVSDEEATQLQADYRDGLDAGENIAVKTLGMVGNEHTIDWGPYLKGSWDEHPDTGVALKSLRDYAKRLDQLPDGFELHPRVSRIMKDRSKMAAGAAPVDWGFAENLAYATMVGEGHQIRLCGQDAGRGTFFHRHAALHNQRDGSSYIPLKFIKEPHDFTVIDSFLSEEAVLAFEYGIATANPEILVIWEAQFGDFANGAQVVIDQFIASGEEKWGRLCGLTMFLPHGYEGQGPEHSSARLERYLQLCAQNNMQVCVPTTPAQAFHMLRRQMLRKLRKPLIVLTPKSLLRHREAVSTLEELVSGEFQLVIPEVESLDTKKVERVVFCTGKVYYDLLKKRRDDEITDTALVRIEQLYPFPLDEYVTILKQYPNAVDIVWCQEEPLNQGAWYQIRHRLTQKLRSGQSLRYAGREGTASTAAGYAKLHAAQQAGLVEEAFGLVDAKRTRTRKVTRARSKAGTKSKS